MKIDDPLLLYAIASHCSGKADDEAEAVIRKWLAEDPLNKRILSYLMNTSFASEVDESEETREKIYSKILERIRDHELPDKQVLHPEIRAGKQRKQLFLRFASAAAVLLVLVLGGIFLMTRGEKSESVIVHGNLNEVVDVTLADGSLVSLNAASTLSYPETFNRSERRVKLSGEAFFNVTRNERKPFVVELGNAEVRVLGTRFNVKGYESEEKIIATLLEGSVQFTCGDNGNQLLLQPNQQAVYDRHSGTLTLHQVEAPLFSAWKEGGIYFDNVDLNEIARILERTFGLPVVNETTGMGGQHFSGMFEKDSGLLQILDMLKRHRAFDYEKKNGAIRLFDI